MLEIFVYPLLRTRRRHMLFQLDGAPPHWGLQVCAFLKDKFLERWIGRGEPAAWPPEVRSNAVTTASIESRYSF